MTNKPIAALISDVHYNINTLPLADAAMRQAIDKANSLDIPLIVAGDLHDSKANLRGECVNAMLKTFSRLEDGYIMVGNHDKINEKSEEHSLNFLDVKPVNVVNSNCKVTFYYDTISSLYLIPYHSNPDELRQYLKTIPRNSTLVMHQGINKANSGEYIQDKSAITTADVAGFRVISGHYHTRQTIDLPDGGKWDYIGNPYTLNYAESNDPSKGFQILYSDGSLEFVPTNLRKHIVMNIDLQPYEDEFTVGGDLFKSIDLNDIDLLWVKVTGRKEYLNQITKKFLGPQTNFREDFRLDLIPTETEEFKAPKKQLTNQELLDSIIEASQTSEEGKIRIKSLWRGMV